MNWKRIFNHLMSGERAVGKLFPIDVLARIEQAIAASEKKHSGEIRFAVESSLDHSPLLSDQSPRDRALDVFSSLRIWDTEHNNGVLVYVLLADHAVEIVADRGLNKKVPAEHWTGICSAIEEQFKAGAFEEGVLAGIEAVSKTLVEHFPCSAEGGENELPNQAVVL